MSHASPASKNAGLAEDSADNNTALNTTLSDPVQKIGGDVIDTQREFSEYSNVVRARYCEIVGQNAEKRFPKSKPYLEMILKANNDYRDIYDIPPEYFIALLYKESRFNKYAVSPSPAVGIAQFMRTTAADMDMQTYSRHDHPELFKYETRLAVLNNEVIDLWDDILKFLNRNDFDALKNSKKKYDLAFSERNKALKEFTQAFTERSMMNLIDDRLNPEISIDKSMKYLALLCRDSEKYFDGKPLHNTIRGIAAYNAGMRRVKKKNGIPFIKETVDYISEIILLSDRISPKQQVTLDYLSNKQLIAESVVNARYSMPNIRRQ